MSAVTFGPARCASAIAGTSPARDTRFGSSNDACVLARLDRRDTVQPAQPGAAGPVLHRAGPGGAGPGLLYPVAAPGQLH